jgi:GntR family transcriptional repressor for pyruvate dehydrogenase complex
MNQLDDIVNIKGPSLKERVADLLTDHIISSNFESGTYLPPEGDLAISLGVGKSTVREAIQILESRGLVQRRPGKGIQIVDNCREATTTMLKLLLVRGETSVGELLEIRNAIEVKAAFWAAKRVTAEDIKRLAVALEVMQSNKSPLNEYYAADLAFHLNVARAAHNKGLALLIETLRPLLLKAILACAKTVPRPELNRPYHARIFEAIKVGNPEMSAINMEKHLEGTKELLEKAGFDEHSLLKDII